MHQCGGSQCDTAVVMAALACLKRLKSLQVTYGDSLPLHELPLEWLRIEDWTGVNPELWLNHPLRHLSITVCADTKLSALLSTLPHLESFALERGKLSEEDQPVPMPHLKRLRLKGRLEFLDLSNTRLNAEETQLIRAALPETEVKVSITR